MIATDALLVGDPDPRYDLNEDGINDVLDVHELLYREGLVAQDDATASFITLVNLGEALTLSIGWEGTGIDQSLQPVPYGFLGCLWCAIKCAGSMKDAADCAELADQKLDQCWKDNMGDPFAQAECFQKRNQWILDCLDDVANVAGDCAKCIKKCAPSPAP